MTDGTVAPDATASPPPLADDIKTLNAVKADVKSNLVERDADVDMIALSMVSRVHGLIIGEPGIAKSMTVDLFMERLTGVAYFNEILRKALPVEALIGPVSVQGLTNDVYRYITTDMLPEADVAFLDEVFKGNSVTLNTTLKILNERKFKSNGGWIDVPLWFAIGASNELPTETDLMAFRDRFGWCRNVEHVKSDDGFKEILRGQVNRNSKGKNAPQAHIGKDAVLRLQSATRAVTVGDDVLQDLANMRRKAEAEANLHVSPRRYGEGVRLAQAMALLNGRQHVISDDLTLFQHVLWTDVDDISAAVELTLDFAGRVAKQAAKLRQALDPLATDLLAIKNEMAQNAGQITGDSINKLAPISMGLRKVKQQVEGEIADAKSANRDTGDLDSLLGDVNDALSVIRDEIMS